MYWSSTTQSTLFARLFQRKALVVLTVVFVLALGVLVWLAFDYESTQNQRLIERHTLESASAVRAALENNASELLLLGESITSASSLSQAEKQDRFKQSARQLLRKHLEIVRIEWRDTQGQLLGGQDGPGALLPALDLSRGFLNHQVNLAFNSAITLRRVTYASSYFVVQADRTGFEVMDVLVPVQGKQDIEAVIIAVYALPLMLEHLIPPTVAKDQVVSLTEPDGTHLARRKGAPRGLGVYTAREVLDLPGAPLMLQLNSLRDSPSVVPNTLSAVVLLLAALLTTSLVLLWRDVQQRHKIETRLLQESAFRTAMENSLVTGLRARDISGRITYVNPAFCEMTGFSEQELIGCVPPMPYWAPETLEEMQARESTIQSGTVRPVAFDAIYLRKDGQRMNVQVYTAPLVDEQGVQTGWMSSVLDVTQTKKMQAITEQQQERLQSAARLVTMGEMASALSHELNQPLAAINSYASACENLLGSSSAPSGQQANLQTAISRIREQAQRAGQVIRSVHDFVRRRPRTAETFDVHQAIEAVMPLIDLQLRNSQVKFSLDMTDQALHVHGDRTMIEQVIANLARNSIEAMQAQPEQTRYLTLRIRPQLVDEQLQKPGVLLQVIDTGPGVDQAHVEQLFTAFASTKPQGMGMGLSVCRTVVEQHAGRLWYQPNPVGGAIFSVILPLTNPQSQPVSSHAATEPLAQSFERTQ